MQHEHDYEHGSPDQGMTTTMIMIVITTMAMTIKIWEINRQTSTPDPEIVEAQPEKVGSSSPGWFWGGNEGLDSPNKIDDVRVRGDRILCDFPDVHMCGLNLDRPWCFRR